MKILLIGSLSKWLGKKNEMLTSINFMESKFDKTETTTREQIEGNDNE